MGVQRHLTLALTAITALAGTLLIGPPANAVTSQTVSITASRLIDSVGVNVHSGYTDEAYGAQWSKTVDRLKSLGFKHVRDDIKISPQSYVPSYTAALKTAGIKQDLILGNPAGKFGEFALGQQASAVSKLKSSTYAGTYDLLEGPNEQDINGGSSWVSNTHTFMGQYFAALNADSATAGFTVLAPSMAHTSGYTSYGADSNNDAGTMHSYAGEATPEGAWLDNWISGARKTVGTTKPLYTTEFGYQMATGSSWSVDAQTQADYSVRGLIWNLKKGIKRSYLYELYDSKPDTATGSAQTNVEKHFGLYYTGTGTGTASGWTETEKPSAKSIRNLLGRLADTSTGTAPTSYPYSYATSGTDVKVIPIARKNGSIDLAIWRAAPLWNGTARVSVAPVPVTVTLGSSKPVASYRPSSGSLTTISASTSSFTVKADGQVTLVRVG